VELPNFAKCSHPEKNTAKCYIIVFILPAATSDFFSFNNAAADGSNFLPKGDPRIINITFIFNKVSYQGKYLQVSFSAKILLLTQITFMNPFKNINPRKQINK